MMKQADLDDIEIVAEMAFLLWPDHDISDLKFELSNYISTDNGAVFIFVKLYPLALPNWTDKENRLTIGFKKFMLILKHLNIC